MIGQQRTAGELMSTPVVVASADDHVAAARNALLRTGLRHLVVLLDRPDGEGCAGVLDDRALALREQDARTPVMELVRARTSCVRESSVMQQIAAVMLRDHTDAVPVLRDDGRVVGIVTTTDLLRVIAALEPETARPLPRQSERTPAG